MNKIAQSVLNFWFAEAGQSLADAKARMGVWFSKDSDFDYDIERRFGKLVSLAAKDGFDNWSEEPKSNLALIILLDQFPRNLYRGSAKAFATDKKALELTRLALTRGDMDRLVPLESVFLLMPCQHAENLEDQNLGVDSYNKLAEISSPEWKEMINNVSSFAERHRAVIEKFGRFPHRNGTLGRTNTAEEQSYLESGGETF